MIGASTQGLGQQQFIFTNYLLNQYYYNPALPGTQDVHYANFGYRNQWVGFDESPSTINANFYGSVKNQMKHGYGISVVSDKAGLINNNNIQLNYAYQLNLTDSLRLGFGIRPGFQQYNINLYDARLADTGDDVLEGDVISLSAIDMDAGLHLYHYKFFVTLAARQLFANKLTFTKYNHALARHFTLIAGYNFISKKKKLVFQPSILLQYVKPADPQLTLMTKLTYDKKYWMGLFARTQDAFGAIVGVNLWKRWSFGYGFDYSVGQVRGYNGGSHEICISFITTQKKADLDKEDEDINNGIFDENKTEK